MANRVIEISYSQQLNKIWWMRVIASSPQVSRFLRYRVPNSVS